MSLAQDKSTYEKACTASSKLHGQAQRLTDRLAEGPALTYEISRDLAIGNISSAAAIAKVELEKLGVTIVATLPDRLIKNRFGETSMTHVWRLTRLR